MNTEITTYDFRGNDVRVLTDKRAEPWFVAKDICDVLGTDTKDLRAILDGDEIANLDTIEVHHTAGRAPLIVSESGFYKLVMRSRKPVAKEFQRCVTRDVLPSIRKHGAYMTPDTIRQALADPDTLIMLATRLKEETEEKVAAREGCAHLTRYRSAAHHRQQMG
ncbi:phage antirepressor protein [Bifidobacterium pseudolongum subsp. globosum]|uniref:Phage antirepressor protein n=1 Tax=Bifidobacterium pseudolongum subsp. globosum TaxID=1690 RepID=A0A4Q5BC92_9BIFI|nr:BRO family protein [Bifidobacterium pseudolongum]RYQ68415.1 phage antirepressor protein [Bifidobacterium pseudolongum subsp. globosum]